MGDIFIEGEAEGWYGQCLQCGYVYDIPCSVELYKHSDDKRKKELSALHS